MAMDAATAVDTYDYKKLFYMACGYISATDAWSDKHPMEVVDFFIQRYTEINSLDV
jgi:hypothetical protein